MSELDNVLLIGATGGTGYRAIQGFLDQGVSNLRVMTRKVDTSRAAIAALDQLGIKLVEADLDDLASLEAAFADVSRIYCHATAGDYTQADPVEVERAKRVAQAAQHSSIQHLVYNSSGGVERNSGIPHIEQKYRVEQIFQQAGLPTTMLRSCLFMEEFWKKYTRPSILKGNFRFSVQSNRPLHLVSVRDVGRVAAYVMQHGNDYIGQAIELASDVLTPQQMAAAFSQVQDQMVKHRELPAWLFLLFGRKTLFDLIQWYRNAGYQANVDKLQSEFPGLLTSFATFLQETHWNNPELSYEDLCRIDR